MRQKTIGIEIECYIPSEHRGDIDAAFTAQVNYNRERWNTTTRPYWKGIPDGSLNNPPRGYQGFEMIMPPLMPSEAFKQLELVLDVLNRYGAKVRKCCGCMYIAMHKDLLQSVCSTPLITTSKAKRQLTA